MAVTSYDDYNAALALWRDSGDTYVTHDDWSDDEMNKLHNMELTSDAVTVANEAVEVIKYELTVEGSPYINISRVAIFCDVRNVDDWTVETSLDDSDWDNWSPLSSEVSDPASHVYVNVGQGVRFVRITIDASEETKLREIILYTDPTYSDHDAHSVFVGPVNTGTFAGAADGGTENGHNMELPYYGSVRYLVIDPMHPCGTSGFLFSIGGYGNASSYDHYIMSVENNEHNYWVRDVKKVYHAGGAGGTQLHTPFLIIPPLRVVTGDFIAWSLTVPYSHIDPIYCDDGASALYYLYVQTDDLKLPGDVILKDESLIAKTSKELKWFPVDNVPVDPLWPYVSIPDPWVTGTDGIATQFFVKNLNVGSSEPPQLRFWPYLTTMTAASNVNATTINVVDASHWPTKWGKVGIIDPTFGNEVAVYESKTAASLTFAAPGLTLEHADDSYVVDYSSFMEFSKDAVTWYKPEDEQVLTYASNLASQGLFSFYMRKTRDLDYGFPIDEEVLDRLVTVWPVVE